MTLTSYDCAICGSSVEETLEHLFFQCPLTMACWSFIQVHVGNRETTFEVLENIKEQLHTPIFMNIIILMCWTIWECGLIFQGTRPSISRCREAVKKELVLLQHRVKSKHKNQLEERINFFG